MLRVKQQQQARGVCRLQLSLALVHCTSRRRYSPLAPLGFQCKATTNNKKRRRKKGGGGVVCVWGGGGGESGAHAQEASPLAEIIVAV